MKCQLHAYLESNKSVIAVRDQVDQTIAFYEIVLPRQFRSIRGAEKQQDLILVRAYEVVAVVEINRQVARNALSVALIADLTSALDRIDANPAVKVMVLTGAGAHFAVRTDIKEMLALSTVEVSANDFSGCSERLASMRKPVIAAVGRYYDQ